MKKREQEFSESSLVIRGWKEVSPRSIQVQDQPSFVHSLSDLDNLLLRKDGSGEGVLERNDLGRRVMDVVLKNEVGLDVVFEGEMVAVGGKDS